MTRRAKIPINEELAGIDAALRRAAKAALLLARKTNTPCYIWKDGQIVDIAARKKKPVQGN
jgi:hypothetical protein